MMEEPNPYAAPQVESFEAVPPTADTDAERIRKRYLNHEASVQSIGLLYYLGGGLLVLGIVLGGMVAMQRQVGWGVALVIALVYGGLAAVLIMLGRGLQTLHRYVRIPVAIISCVTMLLALFGLVAGGSVAFAMVVLAINAYILFLLLSSKGSMVFSAQYAEIRRQTPHIKYRTSILIRVAAAILLVFSGLGVVGALAAVFRLGW